MEIHGVSLQYFTYDIDELYITYMRLTFLIRTKVKVLHTCAAAPA